MVLSDFSLRNVRLRIVEWIILSGPYNLHTILKFLYHGEGFIPGTPIKIFVAFADAARWKAASLESVF